MTTTTMPEQEQKSPDTGSEAAELLARLDTLLERYLNLLDEHEKARSQGHSDFRGGLFSLAEANFRSSSRVRFGQDLYDDKMQATFVLEHAAVSHSDSANGSYGPYLKLHGQSTVFKTQTPELPPSETTPEMSSEQQQDSHKSEAAVPEHEEDKVQQARAQQDPIRQFGVLVPPALRKAQASFRHAVDGWVEAVNVSRELQCMELEIRRVRKHLKKLGL